MEYRIGKCSSCEAEYKIPASFAHDAARCKQCGGTVNIAPTGGPGTPQPQRAEAPRPKPQPKPAPKRVPAAAPRPAAAKPAAAADKKKGSTLERLKAERRAEREVAESRKAGQPQRSAAARPAAHKGAGTAGAAVAGAAAGARAGAGAGHKGTERQSGSGRWHPPKKKKSPVGLIGIVVLAGMGAGGWFFRDTLFGSEEATAGEKILEAKLDETALDAEGEAPIEMPAEGADPDSPTETPAPEPDAPEDIADPASSEEPPVDASTETPEPPAGAPDPFAEVDKRPTRAPDPDSVDLLALGTFAPAIGCSEAEWDQMHTWLDTWMDPDAGVQGNRAKAKLIGQGYEAIPVILNRMLGMDFSTSAGQDNGSQCQAALREICAGLNFNWKDGTEPGDVVFNKKVVKAWAKLWEDASTDVGALIKILKLELEGTTPEGNELRELYGVEPIEIQTEADAGGQEEDDFEID